jgi:hypothetical protein
MFPEDLDHDGRECASIEGVEVEEFHDPDTVRFFVREWQWRARVHFGDRSMTKRRSGSGGGIIDS